MLSKKVIANNLITTEINQQRTAIINKKGTNQIKKSQLKAVRKKLKAIAPNRGHRKRVRRAK